MLQRLLYPAIKQLYTFLWILALPIVIARLWLKSKKLPAYKQRMLERFGINSLPKLDHCIWIHAVSVGETEVAKTLIAQLKQQQPDALFFVSTTTPTGSDNILKSGLADFHSYIPYDLPCLLKRLIKKINPSILIIIETELWPNLIETAQKHCPVAIVNARLSDKSFKRYHSVKPLITPILNKLSLISCSDADSQSRFQQLGYNQHLATAGNIKFDNIKLHQKQPSKDTARWIAASTHEGEEQIAINAHRELLSMIPSAQLLLAPRHPDRFKSVESLIKDSGLSYQLVSATPLENFTGNIILLDEMGRLKQRYAEADIAFVGGSLVNCGGHNMIEPIAAGTATLIGHYYRNFKTIVETLRQADAITILADAKALSAQLQLFFKQPDAFEQQLINGQNSIKQQQGATKTTCDSIQQLLNASII